MSAQWSQRESLYSCGFQRNSDVFNIDEIRPERMGPELCICVLNLMNIKPSRRLEVLCLQTWLHTLSKNIVTLYR